MTISRLCSYRMNKIFHSALLLLCGLAIMSCRQAAVQPEENALVPIQFRATAGAFHVKATDTAFELGDAIGLSVSKPVGVSNALLQTVSDGLAPQEPIYWPFGHTAACSFDAYYPYKNGVDYVSGFSFTVNPDQSTHALYTASDFMSAHSVSAPADGVVELAFTHEFSKLVLVIDNKLQEDIAEVYVGNVKGRARVVAGSAPVAAGLPGTIKAGAVNLSGIGPAYAFVMVPQETSPKLMVTTVSGKQYTYILTEAVAFASGMRYLTHVTISADSSFSDLSIEVSEWTDNADIEFKSAFAEVIEGVNGQKYTVTGTITQILDANNGNMLLEDEGRTIYIYGLLTPDGKYPYQAGGLSGDAFNIAVGDQITVYGTRTVMNEMVTLRESTFIGAVRDEEMKVNVTTGDSSDVSSSSATVSGSYSDASGDVRECGFKWGMSASSLDQVAQADNTGSPFSATLTNLGEERTYYYCAYVILQKGNVISDEFLGEVKSFTTTSSGNPGGSGVVPQWAELPRIDFDTSGTYKIDAQDNSLYYAWHISPDIKGPENRLARNYTVCFSAEHHCPVWVAAPRHSMYVGNSGRTEAYGPDPDIPADIQYNSKSTGGGCNKGHMLGSAERTCSKATNRQVFYYSNIAPQLSSGFNTGGGGWNILEDYVDGQVCADTLYVVIGCYFDEFTDGYDKTASPGTISFGGRSDVSIPTMFYYILLRTKNGKIGKSVKDCSASELKCAAFVRTHTNALKGQKVSSKELMSVADLEKITGFTYFPNVPNAPKTSFSASDWGL